MNLLFISNLYPPLSLGGYEQACRDVAESLEARGHHVRILTSAYRKHEVSANASRVDRTLELIPSLRAPRLLSRALLGPRRFNAESRNSAILIRTLMQLQPDAVVVWNGRGLGDAVIRVAQNRAPVAFYLADKWLAGPLRAERFREGNVFARVRRRALSLGGVPMGPLRAEHMIFCSHALLGAYRKAGIPVTGATVMHLGIPTNMFFPAPRVSMLPVRNGHSILFVGRICPEKGVTTLVRALGRVRSMTGLDATTLSVCGPFQDDFYRKHLLSLINQLRLSEAVQLKAPRQRAELLELYRSHEVLAFPSEWEEPFPLTLLEAMSVGMPVVSSLRGGSAEIIRSGHNGLAFEAGNVDDLAEKLAWVLSHRSEAARMGLEASEIVRRQYSLESLVDPFERTMTSLISTRAAFPTSYS